MALRASPPLLVTLGAPPPPGPEEKKPVPWPTTSTPTDPCREMLVLNALFSYSMEPLEGAWTGRRLPSLTYCELKGLLDAVS